MFTSLLGIKFGNIHDSKFSSELPLPVVNFLFVNLFHFLHARRREDEKYKHRFCYLGLILQNSFKSRILDGFPHIEVSSSTQPTPYILRSNIKVKVIPCNSDALTTKSKFLLLYLAKLRGLILVRLVHLKHIEIPNLN